MTVSPRVGASAAVLAAVVAASVAFASGGAVNPPAKASDAAAADQKATFGILAVPTSASDGKNPFALSTSAAEAGFAARDARRARIGGWNAWVGAGKDNVCVAIESTFEPSSFFGSCNSVSVTAADGLWFSSRPSPQIAEKLGLNSSTLEFAGLVPDGVKTVALTNSDGSTTDIPVVDNIAVGVARSPKSVRFRTPDGSAHVNPLQ